MGASAWTPVPPDQAGWTPVPQTAAPPADKSLLQRAQDKFDELTTVTPEQEAGHSWLTNKAQEFGAHVIHGVGGAIVHPLDALNGVGNAIAHPIDTAVAMGKSAIADPVGTAGELVGGALLGEAGAGAASAIAKPLGNAATKGLLLGKTPAEAYESALKPSITMNAAKKSNAVQGGLENAIPLSKAGAEKIADRIDELNKNISDTIAADPTRPINPNAVATRADQAKARFAQQVNAQPDLDAIEASKQQFLKEQGAIPQSGMGAPPMNASDAQAMKQGTYKVLSGKFGEQGSASVEAQKALARGLKEEIATQFPEISGLNTAESKLLDLQPLVERAVNRMNNQGVFRLGTGAVVGTIKALGGSNKVAAVGAILKQVLDDPMIKSRLAIALSKGGKIPYSEAAARVSAYSSALGSSAAGPTAPDSQGYSSGDSPNQSTRGQP